MDKAASRFRIGLMFTVMGVAVLGSIVAIRSGKKDRAAHINTLPQRNKERHARVKGADASKQ